MHVRCLQTIDQVSAIESAWNRLSRGNPFLQPSWLLGWWRHLGNGQLFVLAVFDSDSLVGVAPWYIEQSSVRGNVIRFLGSGLACTDYLSIACLPEHHVRVAQTLAEFLDQINQDADGPEDRWDLLLLEGIQVSDPMTQQFSRVMSDRGMTVHVMSNSNCWRIELPATWDEYLQSLSKSHRKQIRQAERRLLLSGKAKLHSVTVRSGFEPILAKLIELNERRRAALNETGCFGTNEFQKFIYEATGLLLDRRECELHWLDFKGQMVAAELHLVGNGIAFAYQSGIDVQSMDIEPGRLITIALIQQSIQRGFTGYDFCRGDEPYKAHWRATPYPTADVRIVANWASAEIRHNMWLAGSTVKRWVKSTLGV